MNRAKLDDLRVDPSTRINILPTDLINEIAGFLGVESVHPCERTATTSPIGSVSCFYYSGEVRTDPEALQYSDVGYRLVKNGSNLKVLARHGGIIHEFPSDPAMKYLLIESGDVVRYSKTELSLKAFRGGFMEINRGAVLDQLLTEHSEILYTNTAKFVIRNDKIITWVKQNHRTGSGTITRVLVITSPRPNEQLVLNQVLITPNQTVFVRYNETKLMIFRPGQKYPIQLICSININEVVISITVANELFGLINQTNLLVWK